MNIYVGNLTFETTDDSLQASFTEFGEVTSARVITDRESGRSRGFGFVEMPQNAQAEAAIQAMNGKDIGGRNLTVNEARPKEDRGNGGGGRGYGGGGGGGGRWRLRRRQPLLDQTDLWSQGWLRLSRQVEAASVVGHSKLAWIVG